MKNSDKIKAAGLAIILAITLSGCENDDELVVVTPPPVVEPEPLPGNDAPHCKVLMSQSM